MIPKTLSDLLGVIGLISGAIQMMIYTVVAVRSTLGAAIKKIPRAGS